MSLRHKKSVSLLELLIALVLLTMVVLGFTSIDLFSRYHVLTSDRRAQLQNEISHIIEHMTKNLERAVGGVNNPPVRIITTAVSFTVSITIDSIGNGKVDPLDATARYVYRNSTYTLQYSYNDPTGINSPAEDLSTRITAFTVDDNWDDSVKKNFVTVDITACWDPTEATSLCNTPDNPSVNMQAKIKMPSVSTN